MAEIRFNSQGTGITSGEQEIYYVKNGFTSVSYNKHPGKLINWSCRECSGRDGGAGGGGNREGYLNAYSICTQN